MLLPKHCNSCPVILYADPELAILCGHEMVEISDNRWFFFSSNFRYVKFISFC